MADDQNLKWVVSSKNRDGLVLSVGLENYKSGPKHHTELKLLTASHPDNKLRQTLAGKWMMCAPMWRNCISTIQAQNRTGKQTYRAQTDC